MSAPEHASLREHYSQFYRSSKDHDSPRESRTRMVRAMTSFILGNEGTLTVLNIGSGRRELEGMLTRNAKGNVDPTLHDKLASTSLVSFDIADIPARRMIGERGSHVQADSRAMPFRSGAFDLTLSNLSIDMLRRQPGQFEIALDEMSRVTKIGGVVLLNYHPPELFDSLSDDYNGHGGYLEGFYNGASTDNPYYQHVDAIVADLENVGIDVDTAGKVEDRLGVDSWWEVTGMKIA